MEPFDYITDKAKKLAALLGESATTGATMYSQAHEPNPEVTKGILGFLPGVGDVISGYDALDSAHQGNYADAALNGIGLLPFVPGFGGILKRADLKPGGPEFGQWKLDRVERRTKPEEYIDATGQERIKYIADMENAEQSWGSGQPVANIYWMKDKRTGEVKPFGDDTAHQALGMNSTAAAKKQFFATLEKQQNDWFAEQRKSLGYEWHNAPQRFERIRELLIKGQINEERALQMMKQGSGK